MKHRKLLIGTSIGCAVLLAGAALYLGCAPSLSRARESSKRSAARYAEKDNLREYVDSYPNLRSNNRADAIVADDPSSNSLIYDLAGADLLGFVCPSSDDPIAGAGAPGFVQLPELLSGAPHSEYVATERRMFLYDAPPISVGGGSGVGWGNSGGRRGAAPASLGLDRKTRKGNR
ncbi:MAG: hypothetical protein IIA66_13905, partial [Planctomycetes bacterium]|nr:hypothetical protein [Planctomycetota bacterium]